MKAMLAEWREARLRPYWVCVAATAQFLVLTVIGMLIFPGGSYADPGRRGYSFFENFFSELGMTVTRGGHSNPVGAALFFIALSGVGLGLGLFFLEAPRLFHTPRAARWASWIGSAFGLGCALCFIGVAFTPANLALPPHREFVQWAFRLFLGAVLGYLAAILLRPGYPHRYAAVYAVFALLLAGYIVLLTAGPGLNTPNGVIIQATGQKIIVYAAVVAMLIQAQGALRLARQINR